MKIKNNRRTKIVATIGPRSETADMISRLIKAGVDVFRLNFSHGDPRQHCKVARIIRKHAAIEGRYVGILADLQGPKIRIGDFENGAVELKAGDKFSLNICEEERKGNLRGVGIRYNDLAKHVNLNDTLLLDDGRIRLQVDGIQEKEVDCTVLVGGNLSSRKGINRLGGGLAAAALTDKDISDIDYFDSIRPDFVAVSFVGSASDVIRAKELLKRINLTPSIIAKIERAEVVSDTDLLNSILQSTDGVMVARGDLGVEVGDAQLIGIQKDIISRARKMNRLVITATQMMESMINNALPTRAEVFDVANAVLDGTDAVMLSAETAVGSYPVEVVKAMSEAAIGAEKHPVATTSRYRLNKHFDDAQETIAMSAIYAANHFDSVRGIACLTESGTTPLLMSRLSSGRPIFSLSEHPSTLQKLSLCRGVVPLYFESAAFDRDEIETRALEFLRDEGLIKKGDSIILTQGSLMGIRGSTNIIKILKVS